jgi:hypothetical protein
MKAACSALVLALTTSSALAQSGTLKLDGMVKGEYETMNISFDGHRESVYVGPMVMQLGNGPHFGAYCVDLGDSNSIGDSYGVTGQNIDTLHNGAWAAELFNKFAGTVKTAKQGAGLQLAIWDVLEDNGKGFSSGAFQVRGYADLIAQATEYLRSNVTGASDSATWLVADDHGRYDDVHQNVLTGPQLGGPGFGIHDAPGPSSIVTFAVGAAGALRARRRRKRS